MDTRHFKEKVWQYYTHNSRDTLPWRTPEQDGTFDPYKIIVSEIMLQQTQVHRVMAKYTEWVEAFPTIESLAKASFADVLSVWLGLGYNRRAQYLHNTAKIIHEQYAGTFPSKIDQLICLPGIGVNTASAILVYAFNEPHVFIETNIRAVYIHHFFNDAVKVSDADILECVKETIDTEHPREWFWALMDYGVYIKKTYTNPARQSARYIQQSAFEGSDRQLRARILHILNKNSHTRQQLIDELNDKRVPGIIDELAREKFIIQNRGSYRITD